MLDIYYKTEQHIMILPSMDCPAQCNYCFGPHYRAPKMDDDILRASIEWMSTRISCKKIDITFHGGEPLLAGIEFYKNAIPKIKTALYGREISLAIQSNLWLLTDEMCALFREQGVGLGTSLDGPEVINDAQRGMGYFQRTMKGICRARKHGLAVGCISTFTNSSAERFEEVRDFFMDECLGFSIHAALPVLSAGMNGLTRTPATYGDLLMQALTWYLEHTREIRISTIDSMCRSVSCGLGGICNFGDCLGQYLAIDSQGWIYPASA